MFGNWVKMAVVALVNVLDPILRLTRFSKSTFISNNIERIIENRTSHSDLFDSSKHVVIR